MTSSTQRLPRLTLADLCARLGLLFTSAYGLLYFSYKYLLPPLGIGDSDYYYPLYRAPLSLAAGKSPFVLRQVGVVLTWLAWKAHLFYPNDIAYADPHYDQHIFFASLFTNWVCFLLAAFTAGLIAEHFLGRRDFLLSTLAAFLCIFSFHSQSAVITDIAEGPAWLLMTLAVLAMLKRSWPALLLLLVLATFQREMILLAAGFLAALELLPWGRRSRFPLFALAASILCFAAYLAMRRALGGWDFQSHPTSLLRGLLGTQYDLALLFQTLLSQNILFLALAASLAVRLRPPAVRSWLPKLLATFAFLVLISFGSFEGNNAGRLAGILTPLFAAIAAVALVSYRTNTITQANPEPARNTNVLSWSFLAFFLLLLPAARLYQITHPRPPKKPHLLAPP